MQARGIYHGCHDLTAPVEIPLCACMHAWFNGNAQYDLLGDQVKTVNIALQNLLHRFMQL